LSGAQKRDGGGSALRRDLGTLESYAALIGILIGAGIFKVTGQAWLLTGPSVILGYLVLAPAVLATSVAYSVYLSTPLGREPGGEYTHLSRTFGGYGLAFVGAWLKIISYIGALAYLALAFAEYLVELSGGLLHAGDRLAVALAALAFFYAVHVVGVRWFGRIQVAMCALLGLSILVLVVPGLFAIHPSNYRPFFTHGWAGFAASLPPLFFAYAGFESLAQAAGEVKDSTRRLPIIFTKGILVATAAYFLMSAVAFGVLPGARLAASAAPMAQAASVYLPVGAAWFVGLGAVMALTTSVNATMLVPSRLALMLTRDRLAPRWLGSILPATGTPVLGLTITFAAAALLLVSGQVSLALNIAVFALVVLYFLHSLALLLLPKANPVLFASVTARVPLSLQRAAAILSMAAMGGLIALQVAQDASTLARLSFAQRISQHALTTLELCATWAAIGAAIYALGRRRGARERHDYEAALKATSP
jgi:basic amino acid/polyamine antiporter, APA family